MSGTYQVVMGERGRLVIPAELRERLQLAPGSTLILLESEHGLVLATREQVKKLVRTQLEGTDLVTELLAERRRQAAADDAA
ncbi:AbrB/MazE/SpoVT family DNA-binding domain-containing protein [Arthrobacter sp. I2-34]|uniref:AbrB/MazE/SpoVT family DNA-binding domain-containing protein n=1 Tax=Arthrobacter hankyongi TaxID=2904801 RepID=A0ABS9L9Z9_9MICC|nr:AbrB/MazE/SpoVT family DNA-binding domain-containing protein [Arthrobacter hankyongi]MCG2623302.1 AbrB/MazE/SpoVT family DNA-binding domain-containing protein [Arthrobacter hankyongi]